MPLKKRIRYHEVISLKRQKRMDKAFDSVLFTLGRNIKVEPTYERGITTHTDVHILKSEIKISYYYRSVAHNIL